MEEEERKYGAKSPTSTQGKDALNKYFTTQKYPVQLNLKFEVGKLIHGLYGENTQHLEQSSQKLTKHEWCQEIWVQAEQEIAATGQNGSCWKGGRVIPCELGVASLAGSFLPLTACLVTPLGPL